jgi:hypothetical protein
MPKNPFGARRAARRMVKLSATRHSEIARQAARARWASRKQPGTPPMEWLAAQRVRSRIAGAKLITTDDVAVEFLAALAATGPQTRAEDALRSRAIA